MASTGIEAQVAQIGSVLGHRLDELAPRIVLLSERDVHAGAGGAVTTGCGSREQLA